MSGVPYDLFRLMCARRGGQLRSVQSVFLNTAVWSLLGGYYILPDLSASNSFYFFPVLNITVITPAGAGDNDLLGFESNADNPGDNSFPISKLAVNSTLMQVETNVLWLNPTGTVGQWFLTGTCYKVNF